MGDHRADLGEAGAGAFDEVLPGVAEHRAAGSDQHVLPGPVGLEPIRAVRLAAVDLEVFPAGLPDLIRAVLPGWDGVTRDLGEAREA